MGSRPCVLSPSRRGKKSSQGDKERAMPTLYYNALSSPCRAVMMTAKMAGVALTLKSVNLMAGEQMADEFVRMNIEHTVPVLDDGDGFFLAESRAICTYLVQRYSNSDRLYPKDARQHAVVDQRLYFDACTFYESFSACYYPTIFRGQGSMSQELKTKFQDSLRYLEFYLSKTPYAAGDHLTVADLCLLSSAATMKAVDAQIFDDYPHITKWLQSTPEQVADYRVLNQDGADVFGQMAQAAMAKTKSK